MRRLHFSSKTAVVSLLISLLFTISLCANPLRVVKWSNTKALQLQRNKHGKLDSATEKL